jgi:hypothetical protein
VITIDEFEVEYGLSQQKFQRIRDLLETLSLYLRHQTHLPLAPVSFFIATVPGNEDKYPELDLLLAGADARSYELKPLSKANLRDLGKRIHELYAEVYGTRDGFDGELFERVRSAIEKTEMDDSGLTRAFVKRYIAALDSQYGPGPSK